MLKEVVTSMHVMQKRRLRMKVSPCLAGEFFGKTYDFELQRLYRKPYINRANDPNFAKSFSQK